MHNHFKLFIHFGMEWLFSQSPMHKQGTIGHYLENFKRQQKLSKTLGSRASQGQLTPTGHFMVLHSHQTTALKAFQFVLPLQFRGRNSVFTQHAAPSFIQRLHIGVRNHRCRLN